MTELKLPPFRSLLKSKDVEDPINLLVHRPLAYAFCWTIFKTPITPNMVTLMAVIAGALSGAMFIWGTPGAMVAAGAFLWTSAILDGADGILARAKKMSSEFGRAIDGAADMFVSFFTVFPAMYHMWVKHEDVVQQLLMVIVIGCTAVHLWAYDYFKENYLRNTRLDRASEGGDPKDIEGMIDDSKKRGWVTWVAVEHILLPYTMTQKKIVTWLHSDAIRVRGDKPVRNEQTATIFRKHNLWPMRLWTVVSLAPHSYLMAMCAMADRIDIYLWLRLIGMNAVFLVALVLQRRATAKTNEELASVDLTGEASEPALA